MSSSREIPRILFNPKVRYLFHVSSPHISNQRRKNPVYVIPFYFYVRYVIIILLFFCLPSCSSFRSSRRNPICVSGYRMNATCPCRLILPHFITRVICTVVKSTQSCHVSLRVFIQHAVPYSLVDANTPSACSIESQPLLFLVHEGSNFPHRYKQHAKLCFCMSILVFREVNFTDQILCGRK